MVFADLIAVILQKQGITAKQLGLEIGVTGATISNLSTGRVIKPEGKTCQLLLGYCRNHNIDTSQLDWNQIIYNYFCKSRYKKEYEWYSDVDDTGTFKLRHLKCGKVTTLPIMSLDGVSMPCIHCWTNTYMATDAYAIKLDPDSTEYPITHIRCGHRYVVSYEQIKQKKYFCPVCFRDRNGESEAVSYGKRQDYRFLTNPDYIPHIDTGADDSDDESDLLDLIEDDIPLDELSLDDFLLSFEKKPRSSSITNSDAQRKERERLEAECREQERLEAQRRERERLEAERREQERLEAQRREQERLEAERRKRECREAEQRARKEALARLLRCLQEVSNKKQVEMQQRSALYSQLIDHLHEIYTQKKEAEALLLRQAQAERERLEAERREQERLEAQHKERERIATEHKQKLTALEEEYLNKTEQLRQSFVDECTPLKIELSTVENLLRQTETRLSELSFIQFLEKKKLRTEQEKLAAQKAQILALLRDKEDKYISLRDQEESSYAEYCRNEEARFQILMQEVL